MVSTYADAFKAAYQDSSVQDWVKRWGIWRDTKSNLFSESTQQFMRESTIIPDVVKQKYFDGVLKADSLTGGLASSNVLTKGLRYQKLINKGIDVGLEVTENIAGKMNEVEDKINRAIDDSLEAMREEKEQKDSERMVEKSAKKERDLPVIKEPESDVEDDYYPGMKRMRF